MPAVDPDRLTSIPLFETLSAAERAQVALYADEVAAPAGKTLAEEGEFAYEFFVILEGTAEVRKDGRAIAELGPNDFFGEIGLLESERRTATVVAKTPMQLVLMFGPHFRRFEREVPEVAEKVRAAIRDRLSRG
jgi:CRP/FNR family cyclic AMP-dependent transcriptional regulator